MSESDLHRLQAVACTLTPRFRPRRTEGLETCKSGPSVSIGWQLSLK
jgi:hypothetical protein